LTRYVALKLPSLKCDPNEGILAPHPCGANAPYAVEAYNFGCKKTSIRDFPPSLARGTPLWYLRAMPLSSSICGVVLAAGFSSRMGRDKALLPWPPVAEGTPVANTFLGATIDLLQAYSDLVIVVAGKNAPHITPVTYGHGAFLAVNREPERGQFSSLHVGLQEVLERGRDAAFIALIDRPPALPGTVKTLRETFRYADPNVWAVVPEVLRSGEAVHGHPILIGREMIEAFLRAPVTANARDVEHQYQEHVQYVPVEDLRLGVNIDTPEDYARLARTEMISSEKEF
jgi:molybdenum cofactor cytidylyltransferase